MPCYYKPIKNLNAKRNKIILLSYAKNKRD